MSQHVVIKCLGDWFGFACRGAITVPADRHPTAYAEENGWTVVLGTTIHYCPAHTIRNRALEAAR
jgi:hypothetical protein